MGEENTYLKSRFRTCRSDALILQAANAQSLKSDLQLDFATLLKYSAVDVQPDLYCSAALEGRSLPHLGLYSCEQHYMF